MVGDISPGKVAMPITQLVKLHPPLADAPKKAIDVTLLISDDLYPFLEAEASRRGVSFATLISGVLSEDLAKKRRAVRSKKARLPAKHPAQ